MPTVIHERSPFPPEVCAQIDTSHFKQRFRPMDI